MHEGSYQWQYESLTLHLHGLCVTRVTIDGRDATLESGTVPVSLFRVLSASR